jgi:hypothetical protein
MSAEAKSVKPVLATTDAVMLDRMLCPVPNCGKHAISIASHFSAKTRDRYLGGDDHLYYEAKGVPTRVKATAQCSHCGEWFLDSAEVAAHKRAANRRLRLHIATMANPSYVATRAIAKVPTTVARKTERKRLFSVGSSKETAAKERRLSKTLTSAEPTTVNAPTAVNAPLASVCLSTVEKLTDKPVDESRAESSKPINSWSNLNNLGASLSDNMTISEAIALMPVRVKNVKACCETLSAQGVQLLVDIRQLSPSLFAQIYTPAMFSNNVMFVNCLHALRN